MAKVLDGSVEHEGGSYDKYVVTDSKNRKWAIVYDGSINCYNANYNVPLVKTQMKKIIVTAKTLYSHPKNVSKIYAALHTDLAW